MAAQMRAADTTASPEAQVLLRCARARMTPADMAELRRLTAGPLRWEWTVDQAGPHGLVPLVYRHLARLDGHSVPRGAMLRLAERAHGAAARALQHTAELLRVLGALEAAGAPAMALKGPVLAVDAYGDLALREYSDLDVLVAPETAPHGRRALESLGYAPHPQLTPREEAIWLPTIQHILFERRDPSVVVELHWRIAMGYGGPAQDTAALWRRRRTVCMAGTGIHALGDEDLLVYLCVHGASHAWERLEWIACLAELLQRLSPVEWQSLLAHATACRAGRAVRVGAALAADLLGVALPPGAAAQIRADAAVTALAATVRACLFRPPSASPDHVEHARFHLKAMDRTADRAAYMLRLATTPDLRDVTEFPLPARAAWAYALVRPARLCGRAAVRLLRGAGRAKSAQD